MKAIFKTVVLLFLVMICIYQTLMLWFDYPSNRNFFYNVISGQTSQESSQSSVDYDILYPYRALVFDNTDETYRELGMTKSDSINLVDDSLKIVQAAFQDGTYSEIDDITDELWSKGHVLLDIPFDVTKELLEDTLDIQEDWVESIPDFGRIYIFPTDDYEDEVNGNEDTSIDVIFADDQLNDYMELKVDYDEVKLLDQAIELYIENLGEENSQAYFSTTQWQLSMFDNDEFLPVTGQTFTEVEKFYGSLAYINDGKFTDTENYETFVKNFFQSPNNIWKIEDDDEIRYGNKEATTSYFSNGLFEYTLIDDSETATSVDQALSVAEDFLEKDSLLSDIEYVVTDYKTDGNHVTFYYSYAYRNMQIDFESLPEDIDYPMEIEISGDHVTSYRRLLWQNESLFVQGTTFEVRFQEAIDQLMEMNGQTTTRIDQMYMGYYAQNTTDEVRLSWVIESNGKRYYIELE